MHQVYTLTSNIPSWLFATLFSGGVLLQLACVYRHRRCLLYAGSGLVLLAALLDRDITLAIGQILVTWLFPHYRK